MPIDVPIVRAVVRELPDALRPDWGVRTWAGVHGTQELRALVSSIDTTVTLGASGITGTAKVRGRVLGDGSGLLDRVRALLRGTGDEVARGRFGHEIRLHGDGRLQAHHSLLHLSRGARGTGFGNGFVDHARAAYAHAGVDDATMFAGMSVGGYAWARQGLELVTTEATDAARTLDRGRQLARIVDSSRQLVDFSGKIPRFGRRLTAAQHAELAPRLVRGDTLPPNALTSMQELSSIPDVGRRVLLGRMWKGMAEIERSGVWWQANGAHTAQQAAAGVSHRAAPELVARESVAAAQRIAAKLPAAADPFRASETFTRHLAAAGFTAVDDAQRGAQAVLRTSLDEASTNATTTIPLALADGRSIKLTVAWDGAQLVATERVPIRDWRNAELRGALDAAWQELGIDRVRSARTGIGRSIPAL